MGSEPSHEAILTSTGFRILHEKGDNVGGVSIRTLTARIQSAFSSVLNALHSFRTAGSVQGLGYGP